MGRSITIALILMTIMIMLTLAFYYLTPPPPPPAPPAPPAPAPALAATEQDNTDYNQLVADLNKQGGGSLIIQDGTVRILGFAMPDARNVDVQSSVSGKDGEVSGSIVLTIKVEQPAVVTSQGFATIQPGMTYSQVAEALGGEMTRGRMGDGFTGGLAIVQGPRRIDLTFVDSKVKDKSARGLD